MFAINEDKSIYLTRGDVANIEVMTQLSDGANYTFQVGEVIRFKVFMPKECESVILQKDVIVEEATETVTIYLGKNETKFGDFISKPVNYWYEIEVNPDTEPQTIVGYDDEGAKILRLFPEGGNAE